MNKFIIEGPQKLNGSIKISGAKNSALKLMAAAILTEEEVVIGNMPMIADVFTMKKVLESLGVRVKFEGDKAIIKADVIKSVEAPYNLINKMRASILVLGPLLARTGSARIALPGGCKIGLRKIDYHIRALEKMGTEISLDRGFIEAKCGRLSGNRIKFDFPSVGATENAIMASVLAEGATIIENAAREPEIKDLACFLNSMGAKIHNAGAGTITVEGVQRLNGTIYNVIPDRIEAGTFAFMAAISAGEVTLQNIIPADLAIVFEKLRNSGTEMLFNGNEAKIKGNRSIKSTDFITLPFPGFPTDLQAPAMALMSMANGTSIITENVFENRFSMANGLRQMGADISLQNHHAVIKGVKSLNGCRVKVPDLRGGAGLVAAALVAEGRSVIEDVFHIERGYEKFIDKLRNADAEITQNG